MTGGGLTLIANAPNPAGAAILKEKFADRTIAPLGLLRAALAPTFVAILAFRMLSLRPRANRMTGPLTRTLHHSCP